ncbi:hypothetical protein BT93_H3611 [Corymbia citriodora subsp. variegata]|nr:hypothetical protein BT93_H3611 [Corymbia citriodora subsp. variegata]
MCSNRNHHHRHPHLLFLFRLSSSLRQQNNVSCLSLPNQSIFCFCQSMYRIVSVIAPTPMHLPSPHLPPLIVHICMFLCGLSCYKLNPTTIISFLGAFDQRRY